MKYVILLYIAVFEKCYKSSSESARCDCATFLQAGSAIVRDLAKQAGEFEKA